MRMWSTPLHPAPPSFLLVYFQAQAHRRRRRRLVSGLVSDGPPLQILSGVKQTLGSAEPSVLLGGHAEQSEVDQVQGKVDPGDGDERSVQTQAFGDVPDSTGRAVMRGVVTLDGEGDGDSEVVEGDKGVDAKGDGGLVDGSPHSGGQLEDDVQRLCNGRREVVR